VSFTVCATAPPTRVTLLDAAGGSVARWTLQDPTREGRALRWRPEASLRELGSGQGFARRLRHRGFRLELALRWDAGLLSTREAWSGATWAAPETLPTALAHGEILAWAAGRLVRVEPFLGQPAPAWTALALEAGPSLRDTRGVVHPDLELVLQSQSLTTGVVLIQAPSAGGWGLGPWGLQPWGE
jgi:hypothetical protein